MTKCKLKKGDRFFAVIKKTSRSTALDGKAECAGKVLDDNGRPFIFDYEDSGGYTHTFGGDRKFQKHSFSFKVV